MNAKSPSTNTEFPYAVRFSWLGIQYPIRGIDPRDSQGWADAMASIVEHFGLPGDRYITQFDPHDVVFRFRQEQDATVCILKFK